MPKEERSKVPTNDARRQYVRTGGVRCPLCRSEQIEGGPFECEPGVASQEIRCLACGGEWVNLYCLAEILNPDWPNEPSPRATGCKSCAVKTARQPIPIDPGRVNWPLLRRQKESLLRAATAPIAQLSKQGKEDLIGIMHLLDHIQDQAVERLGERTVFGHSQTAMAPQATKPPRRR